MDTLTLSVLIAAGLVLIVGIIVAIAAIRHYDNAKKALKEVIKRGYIKDRKNYDACRAILYPHISRDLEAKEILDRLAELEKEGKLPVRP